MTEELRAFIDINAVQVGDEVKFYPDSNERVWWTVVARDDNHVVAVRQAAFQEKGKLQYTVTERWGNSGTVRSVLDNEKSWKLGKDGNRADSLIEAINTGKADLLSDEAEEVTAIEVKRD